MGKEMYEHTRCKIMIEDRKVGEFRTQEGVSQGCPLSPALFNATFANLEEEMRKSHESGIRIGRTKIYSIAYADDGILLANNKVELRELIRKFEKFIEKNGLKLNVEKIKIMEFRRNAKGRRKKGEFKWKGSKI